MKEYFGKNKVCIYIDQFAASNLFDETQFEIWKDIAKVINEKYQDGKIICPVPTEHFLESSNKTRERAFKVDHRLYELSNGLAFLPEATIAANCMIALVRNIPLVQETFCLPLKYPNTISQDGAYDGFKYRHFDLKTKVTEAAMVMNEFREVISKKRYSRTVMEPLYQASKFIHIRPFLERLSELIITGQIISRGVAFQSGEVIHWVDLLLQLLIWKHKATVEECVELLEIVFTSGFDQIPPLDIRISLTANLAIENKKENINDQIDIMRLSTGLPAADWVFTDKQRKFEVEQLGLDKKYKVKLFTAKKNDLDRFLGELQKI